MKTLCYKNPASRMNTKQGSYGNNVMLMAGQGEAAAPLALFLCAPPAV